MSAAPPVRKPKQKIKPPRPHVKDNSEETWALFRKAVREIHNNRAHRLSYEENYRYAYNLVLYKHGSLLYNGVCDEISQHLDELFRDVVEPTFPTGGPDPMHRSQEGERFLKAFRKVWDDHMSSMSKLRDLLKYMDRTHSPANNLPPIYDKGIDIFVRKISEPNIQTHLVGVTLDQIRIERDGFVIGRSAVKECMDVLLGLCVPSLYKRIIEPPLKDETEQFYRLEAQHLLEACDVPAYLRRVEARLVEEEARTMHYLSSHSHPEIRSILLKHLLEANLQTLLLMPNSGLDPMIDTQKWDDLARLYRLFLLVPLGLPSFRKELKASIENRGNKVNEMVVVEVVDEESSKKDGPGKAQEKAAAALRWVQDVLNLRDCFLNLQRTSFQNDNSVDASMSEGFESFINRNPKAPEYLSLFIDDHLRKGLKGKSDDEIEAVLEKTASLFRYLTDKDVFERYYKNHLAKRLLYGRSVSDDAERGMLAKLKVECGYQFTQKLEGMFNDMRVSVDTTEAYRKHISTLDTPSIDLSITVMTTTFWPLNHSTSTCTLPTELQQAAKLFERFYLSRHSGRKLTWQPALGSVDVRVQFKARSHDLNVPTFGMVILSLFENMEEDEQLSYETIRKTTDIPDIELQRALQALACAKFKILRKHPPSRDIAVTDNFSFNDLFSSNLQKIKIGQISSKVETNEERQETKDRVDEERRHQIEACIVRVMKDRKTLSHNALVTEVTKQLSVRFQAQPAEIKKRIEALIEREYLERREDRKSYNYMA